MYFFIGLHQPSDAQHFDACCISVARLEKRKGPFKVKDWMLDCRGFKTIEKYGGYPHPVSEYAEKIKKWKSCGNLLAAVSQDYMCEPQQLKRTGLTVADHQRLTIERYDGLLRCDTGCYIMPVLQGYEPEEYVLHLRQYGDRLKPGMWVGVGSVCKRNTSPCEILDVLIAIKQERPDLRLHGFGVKTTALQHGTVRALLDTADSMAWSFAARKKKQNANDWRNAEKFRLAQARPRVYQAHLIEQFCEGMCGV
jgi:hypothetical protein